MELLTQAPRGTQDVLPQEAAAWQAVERVMRSEAELHGFGEVRTPVFEHTELFQRGVGDTTDIVQKEMYTFLDKGGRSVTLRPEGTAGAARAMLEHGVFNGGLPVKFYYFTSCYRYEKAQKGRLREFHQFGVELLRLRRSALRRGGHPAGPLAVRAVRREGRAAGDQLHRLPDVPREIPRNAESVLRQPPGGALRAPASTGSSAIPMRILDCKSRIVREGGRAGARR